jgi:hypothetical protein
VSEIRPKTIEQFVRDVTDGKTAKDEKAGPRKRIIVRRGEGAARKVVRDLSAVFTFAQCQEIMKENPCETAAVNKTDNKRRTFLTLDQIRALGKALEELESEGVNPKALNIARLWALTRLRRNEAAGPSDRRSIGSAHASFSATARPGSLSVLSGHLPWPSWRPSRRKT